MTLRGCGQRPPAAKLPIRTPSRGESRSRGALRSYCSRGFEWPLADPELGEDEVWGLFEVEGRGENSLADEVKHCRQQSTMGLDMLVTEGHVSREQLLDSSLDVLSGDFVRFRAGWFTRSHEALEPTLEERRARQGGYLALLGSGVPTTVAFALKALTILDKAEALPFEALLEQIGPALYARAGRSVRQAPALINRAARRDSWTGRGSKGLK